MATKELHYILPLGNLRSVFERGILSHTRAAPYQQADVSLKEVQDIRGSKKVKGAGSRDSRDLGWILQPESRESRDPAPFIQKAGRFPLDPFTHILTLFGTFSLDTGP